MGKRKLHESRKNWNPKLHSIFLVEMENPEDKKAS